MTLTLDPDIARVQAQISGKHCGSCLYLEEDYCLLRKRPVSPDMDSCPDWKLDRVLASTAEVID
jgi:hypothetical protein